MTKIRFLTLGLLLSTPLMWTACSTEDVAVDLDSPENDSGVPITVQASAGGTSTRATDLTGTAFREFSMYGFNVTDTKTTVRLKNVHYELVTDAETGTESWEASRAVTWPNTGWMDFYAICPTIDETLFSEVKMSATNKKLTHQISDVCQEQTDILYALTQNQTRASADGNIVLDFSHALPILTFKAKSSLDANRYQVIMHGMKIYRLQNKGTLNMDVESFGWTLDDNSWGDYTFIFGSDVELTSSYKNLTNEHFFVAMPQKTTAYKTTGGDDATSIASAYADKKTYIGVICKIYDKSAEDYILGGGTGDEEWGEVYFTYGGKLWREGFTYAGTINFNGGYNEDGKLFMETLPAGLAITLPKNQDYSIEMEEWPNTPDVTKELEF